MNKFERAEIKQLILTQIDLLSEKQSHLAQTSRDELRLQRLETALRRIDADNFGDCFKCGKPLAMSRLRITPESVICTACLEES